MGIVQTRGQSQSHAHDLAVVVHAISPGRESRRTAVMDVRGQFAASLASPGDDSTTTTGSRAEFLLPEWQADRAHGE
jgi:hypothetical protein